MASGTSNTVTFKYESSLYTTSTPGTFTTVGGAVTGSYVFTDTPDSAADNTTQLGDITNDAFSEAHASGSTFSRVYVGETSNGSGIIFRTPTKKKGLYSYFVSSNTMYSSGTTVTSNATPFALCFASGTNILTSRGNVAVENLGVGDEVVTATGERRPITWIGSRKLGGESPIKADLKPVRVRAGAFGMGVPYQDLYLSPGHPVLLNADEDGAGGVLIPVMYLINGTSIERSDLQSVVYWHIELATHDILVADGLFAESFLDLGCKPFFDVSSDNALHDPDRISGESIARCRPLATDGPVVDAARKTLDMVFVTQLEDQCAWSESTASSW